jgi:hypothetical protein
MGTRCRLLEVIEISDIFKEYINKNSLKGMENISIHLSSRLKNRIFEEKVDILEEDMDGIRGFVESIEVIR